MVARLRLKHFRLLVAIDEHRSLVKAAEDVALTQPGATKALQEIEVALGDTLFVRTNRGLEPNDLGHCVIRYARLISSDMAQLREEMRGLRAGHGGRLAVGAIMGAIPVLTLALGRLFAERPTLSVQILEGTSEELLRLIDDGRLDAAICRTSVSHRRDAYAAVDIHDEELVVVCGPRHPIAAERHITMVDVADCPWIVCAANMPMRRYAEREFYDAGLYFPQNVIETTSAFVLVNLLAQVEGAVGLLSRDAADFFEKAGLVRPLPIRLKTRSEPYYFVTSQSRAIQPTAELLRNEFLTMKEEAALSL